MARLYYSPDAEEQFSSEDFRIPRIDAHVHCWQFNAERDKWITKDMKLLRQDYLPQQLQTTLTRNGMEGAVLVQASESEMETHFLVELARSHSFFRGVVGWVDLANDNIRSRLEYFSQYPVIKGFRHILQGLPAGFMSNSSFLNGVGALKEFGYAYDILIYANQLDEAVNFASRFPEQPFVIDHCAKPDIKKGEIVNWKKGIAQLAAMPNIYCKVSGLFTEAKWNNWKPADFYPYFDQIFLSFGTDRILFGSDWPVMLLSGSYLQWKSLVEKYMEQFPIEEKEKVFGGNALRFYNLMA